jgi:ribonuclease BN (tRNA processing enzyme)
MLGVGGGPVLNQSHFEPSAALVVNGAVYLIDCGSDAPRQIMASGLGFSSIRGVFVTHHHLDHVGGIPALSPMGWMYRSSALTGQVDFWGPPELDQIVEKSLAGMQHPIDLFKLPGSPPFPQLLPHAFDTPPLASESPASGIVKVMEDENVRVFSCRVYHGDAIPNAFAYRFEVKATGKVVVFSGDRKAPYTAAADAVFTGLARDADVLVHEAFLMSAIKQVLQTVPPAQQQTVLDTLIGGHTDSTQVPGIAKAAGAKRLVINHYVPAMPPPSAFYTATSGAASAVGYAGEIITPTDLDIIQL